MASALFSVRLRHHVQLIVYVLPTCSSQAVLRVLFALDHLHAREQALDLILVGPKAAEILLHNNSDTSLKSDW